MNVSSALRTGLLVVLCAGAAWGLEPPNFVPFEVKSKGLVLAVVADPGQDKVELHKKTWTATVYTVDAKEQRTKLWSTPFFHTGFQHNHVLTPDGGALISVRDIYKPDAVLAILYRPDQPRLEIKGAAFDAPPQASEGWHMWLDGNGSPKVVERPASGARKAGHALELTLIDTTKRQISFADGSVVKPKE